MCDLVLLTSCTGMSLPAEAALESNQQQLRFTHITQRG